MSFKHDWFHFHPAQRPAGWMLREGGAHNWVRMHSLPASKRYPTTDGERLILLARQNQLAAEVLGEEPCWLVQTHWITPPGVVDIKDRFDPFRATRDWKLEFAFDFLQEDEHEKHRWEVYAAKTRWLPGRFDDLLLSIADDKAGPTLWMGNNGAIFAPYDGGMDLFLDDPADVRLLLSQHRDWLSRHPSGL